MKETLKHVEYPTAVAIGEILEALEAARSKFPTFPVDPCHAMAIIGEEYGEAVQAALHLIYEPRKCHGTVELVKELSQLGAMVVRTLAAVHAFDYEPCNQFHDTGKHPFWLMQVPASLERQDR